jgi:hypothetical protein
LKCFRTAKQNDLFHSGQQVEIFTDQIREELGDGDELGDFVKDVLRGGGAFKMPVEGKPGGFSFLIGYLRQGAALIIRLEFASQAKHVQVAFNMLMKPDVAGVGVGDLFGLKFATDLYELGRLFAG